MKQDFIVSRPGATSREALTSLLQDRVVGLIQRYVRMASQLCSQMLVFNEMPTVCRNCIGLRSPWRPKRLGALGTFQVGRGTQKVDTKHAG